MVFKYKKKKLILQYYYKIIIILIFLKNFLIKQYCIINPSYCNNSKVGGEFE